MSTVDQIKDRWPLASMLARLSITIPDRGKFCSPFRPDEKPSCEIYREAIKDRSTGESYDSIRCFAEAHGLSNAEAIQRLAEELPGRQRKPELKAAKELTLPPVAWDLTKGQAVAKLRGIGEEGIRIAGGVLGVLGFGEVGGFECWILADANRKLAEARRMDGKPFPAIGSLGERKAHTLKGSSKSWPLGMATTRFTIPPGLPVILTEGGADYLAACDLLFHAKREFVPVAMLGASQSIHPDALPWFKGRDVLILAHPDGAGWNSAKRWAAQLKSTEANPTAHQLDGGDLNDLLKLHGAKAVATALNL